MDRLVMVFLRVLSELFHRSMRHIQHPSPSPNIRHKMADTAPSVVDYELFMASCTSCSSEASGFGRRTAFVSLST